MSTKDWILLLVPILCNGVVVFLLQKTFERRQLALTEKYKYVLVMQQKVDNALALFIKTIQTSGNDSVQTSWLNQFISSYCEVYYYYQQNQTLFKSLKNHMDELIKTHEQIQSDQLRIKNNRHDLKACTHMESLFCKIYELLQSIQSDCIQRKI